MNVVSSELVSYFTAEVWAKAIFKSLTAQGVAVQENHCQNMMAHLLGEASLEDVKEKQDWRPDDWDSRSLDLLTLNPWVAETIAVLQQTGIPVDLAMAQKAWARIFGVTGWDQIPDALIRFNHQREEVNLWTRKAQDYIRDLDQAEFEFHFMDYDKFAEHVMLVVIEEADFPDDINLESFDIIRVKGTIIDEYDERFPEDDDDEEDDE